MACSLPAAYGYGFGLTEHGARCPVPGIWSTDRNWGFDGRQHWCRRRACSTLSAPPRPRHRRTSGAGRRSAFDVRRSAFVTIRYDRPTVTDASQGSSAIAGPDTSVSPDAVADVLAKTCAADGLRGKRVLAIVPDGTRTAPVGLVFRLLHEQLSGVVSSLDVMIALGTHQPMCEEAICRRLDMTMEERQTRYRDVAFFNHEWDNPAALQRVGVLSAERIHELTDGAFSMDVPVEINRRVFEYDQHRHHRPGVPARGRRLLRRQQVPVPRRRRPRASSTSSTGSGRSSPTR